MDDLVRIEELSDDKESVMALLLMGDESEEMIRKYLYKGRMYVGRMGDGIVAECVVEEKPDNVVEIKNLAVLPEMRTRGIGRLMLEYVESLYPGSIGA